MADTNHTPIPPPVDRATHALARYRAMTILKAQYRSAGKRLTGVRHSQLQAEANALLATHPECWEWAQEAVTNIKISDEARKARKRGTSLSQRSVTK